MAALGGVDLLAGAQHDASAGHSRRRLRAAFSNIGLQVTWCAQGKEAAEFWGRLFNVEVTWFDPELSATKQLARVEEIGIREVGLRRHPGGRISTRSRSRSSG